MVRADTVRAPKPARLFVVIERLDPRVPRFVVVPANAVTDWMIGKTTVVEGRFGGVELGRRTLVPWKERGFSIGIPEPLCRAAGVDTGDEIELEIRLAEDLIPAELASLLRKSRVARSAWDGLTTAAANGRPRGR